MNMERNDEARSELGKFFYSLAKATFTTMVLGSLASIFGVIENNYVLSLIAMILGIALTAILAFMGNYILRRK